MTDKFQHSTGLPDRKSVTNRLIAVRETGVSRHQGGPIEGPPETPRASQYYRIEGIKGVRDWGTKGIGYIVFSVSLVIGVDGNRSLGLIRSLAGN